MQDILNKFYSGRISRKNYAIGVLLTVPFGMAMSLLSLVLGEFIPTATVMIAVIYGSSLHIRRFHDIGASGWWILMALIPGVDVIFFLFLLFSKGSDKKNKYGNPNKKEDGALSVIFCTDNKDNFSHNSLLSIDMEEIDNSKTVLSKKTNTEYDVNKHNFLDKLLRLVFVRRSETHNKWWHRFALVLIYASTIVVGASYILAVLDEVGDEFETRYFTSYSFEKSYESADGIEVDCWFTVLELEHFGKTTTGHCGDLGYIEFLDKLTYLQYKGSATQEWNQPFMPERRKLESPKNPAEVAFYPSEKSKEARGNGYDIDKNIMIELIESGKLDKLRVKEVVKHDYFVVVLFIMLFFGVIFLWILFWESIIYRTILYIVFGSSKVAK